MPLCHTPIHHAVGILQTALAILPICQSAPTGRQPGHLLPNHTTPASSPLCRKRLGLRLAPCPPQPSGPSGTELYTSSTRFKSDTVAVFFCGGGFGLWRISLLSYKSNTSGLYFVCSHAGNLQEIGSEQIPFTVLIHLAKNDGSVRTTSL